MELGGECSVQWRVLGLVEDVELGGECSVQWNVLELGRKCRVWWKMLGSNGGVRLVRTLQARTPSIKKSCRAIVQPLKIQLRNINRQAAAPTMTSLLHLFRTINTLLGCHIHWIVCEPESCTCKVNHPQVCFGLRVLICIYTSWFNPTS